MKGTSRSISVARSVACRCILQSFTAARVQVLTKGLVDGALHKALDLGSC